MNFSRQLSRRRGDKTTALDAANERFAERDVYLHPTKGWRKLNPKRTAAAMHVVAVKAGRARHEVQECGKMLRSIK